MVGDAYSMASVALLQLYVAAEELVSANLIDKVPGAVTNQESDLIEGSVRSSNVVRIWVLVNPKRRLS